MLTISAPYAWEVIYIDDDDRIATRQLQASGHGLFLAKIPGKTRNADARITRLQFLQDDGRLVGTAIIDVNNLPCVR